MARTEKDSAARVPRSRAELACDIAGGQMTVRIRGEIDHHTAVEVRQGIDTRLFERRPRRLLLDLSAVSFMDSSGLGLIMGRLSVMRELGGELVVWNPSREVLRIVTLAGMERLVRIEYPPDHIPERAPDRSAQRCTVESERTSLAASASLADRGAGAPATRQNRENHRDGHRGSTVENRGSTAKEKAPNGTSTSQKYLKTPNSSKGAAGAIQSRRSRDSHAEAALSAALREEGRSPCAAPRRSSGMDGSEGHDLPTTREVTPTRTPRPQAAPVGARGKQRKEKDA